MSSGAGTSASAGPPAGSRWSWLWLLAGGLLGATLLTLLGVPAGAIVGAVLGSAVVSIRGARLRAVPPSTRIVGLVLLGCAAGVRLEPDSLLMLAKLAVPLVGAVVVLLALNVGLALLLTKRYQVDPITAMFACAPGGLSEIGSLAETYGARVGVVVAVHVVRVILVVVLLLPILLVALGH
ncbi:MAG: ammonia monooxygenase [Pseudonocardiaceae bacterium]|nr:ammonia monooxygenase [Pseudonocardiaceae bacterium]